MVAICHNNRICVIQLRKFLVCVLLIGHFARLKKTKPSYNYKTPYTLHILPNQQQKNIPTKQHHKSSKFPVHQSRQWREAAKPSGTIAIRSSKPNEQKKKRNKDTQTKRHSKKKGLLCFSLMKYTNLIYEKPTTTTFH